MLPLFLSITTLTALGAGWYAWCKRRSRFRAVEILRWIETTLGGHGALESIVWLCPSRFRIDLRLAPQSIFRNASVLVELAPRELPHKWIKSAMLGIEETVTFEAEFEVTPHFDLNLHNLRLFARTRRDLEPVGDGWQFEQVTPLIMTTREEWRREITGVMSALLHLREKQFIDLRFSPNPPHYVVALPLGSISPDCDARLQLASTIRELAVEASSYHGLNY